MRSATATLLLLLAFPASAQQPRITPVNTGSDAEFRGLHVSGRVLWASGSGGRYVRSVDGGESWRADSVPGEAELFFVDVHAFGGDTAVLAGTRFSGGEARIYRTTDGGRSWQLSWALEHESVFLDGVAFWDGRRGLAFSDPVDGAFLVLLTEDGGASWTRVPPGHLPPPLPGEAAFAASGTGLVTGDDGRAWFATGGGGSARVFRTGDYGRTWSVSATPLPGGSSAGLFGLAFTSGRNGIAVGGDYRQPQLEGVNVVRTGDGGVTWTLAGATTPPGVKYGVVASGLRLIATSPAGSAWSPDDGRSWLPLPGTGYNTAAFAGDDVAWIAGVKGQLARVEFGR